MHRTKVRLYEVFFDLQYCLHYKNAHYVYETCKKYDQEKANRYGMFLQHKELCNPKISVTITHLVIAQTLLNHSHLKFRK